MNKDDILIVSALHRELPDWELNTNYNVIYTGVGKVNATYRLTSHLSQSLGWANYKPKLIINYGTAASANHKGLVDCTRFVQRDMDATPLGFPLTITPFEDSSVYAMDFSHIKNPINKNLTCYTGDSFVTDMTPYDDVVDMEAYALAKVCKNLNIDFVSYKYISDDGNADDWEKNCSMGCDKFLDILRWYTDEQ